MGLPTGVELDSVTSLRVIVYQVLASKISLPSSTERGYKPGLLVTVVHVKGVEKHWSILIDSGASCEYARRRPLEES